MMIIRRSPTTIRQEIKQVRELLETCRTRRKRDHYEKWLESLEKELSDTSRARSSVEGVGKNTVVDLGKGSKEEK